MMLTDRDEKIYNFINDFKIVHTNTIRAMYFPSLLSCQNRLTLLYKNKILKRDRNGYYEEYVYYIRRKTPLAKHSLVVSDFVGAMAGYGSIEKYLVEYKLNDIRPDLILFVRINGNLRIIIVEAEISNNYGGYNKYARLDWQKFFSVKPTIVYITRQKIVDQNIVTVKPDLSDIGKLIK
jgi:hypothetical protein